MLWRQIVKGSRGSSTVSIGSEAHGADDLDFDLERLRARRNRKWTHFPGDGLPAWIADMDFRTAPPIQIALQHLVADEDYGYPDRDGDTPDRAIATAFARHERLLHGWDPNPDLVQPLPDLVQGMFTTVLAYTEPGDGVVLPFPAYPPFQEAINETDRRLLPIHMLNDGQRWRLDEEHLRNVARDARMIMVSNPHNPTGHVWKPAELQAIGGIALEYDLVIVSDEVHGLLTYPGYRYLPMATVSPEVAAVTVTMNSATKAFNIAGARCAVLHFGSSNLHDRFRLRFPRRSLGAVSVFGVDSTLAAWTHGRPWLERIRAKLTANRTRIATRLSESMPLIGYVEPEATYFAWLDLSAFDLHQPPSALLAAAGVITSPGSDFGSDYRDFVRLNFATSASLLEDMLSRIAEAVAPHSVDSRVASDRTVSPRTAIASSRTCDESVQC